MQLFFELFQNGKFSETFLALASLTFTVNLFRALAFLGVSEPYIITVFAEYVKLAEQMAAFQNDLHLARCQLSSLCSVSAYDELEFTSPTLCAK